MISVDTSILARFYVDDPDDVEARKQRPAARRAMESPSVWVPVSVLMELEWVLRAFYEFGPTDFAAVVNHLLGLPNVALESRDAVTRAIDAHGAGLNFADALHLASSRHCEAMVTFDDRRFARRAQGLGLQPAVSVAR